LRKDHENDSEHETLDNNIKKYAPDSVLILTARYNPFAGALSIFFKYSKLEWKC
jgi:hypothetical protein